MLNRRSKQRLEEAEYLILTLEFNSNYASVWVDDDNEFFLKQTEAIDEYRKKWGGIPSERSYSPCMCIFQKFIRGIKKMADIADNVLTALADLATLTAKVDALDAKVSALTPGTPADLQPILDKLDKIEADLNPTPPPAG